MTIYSRFLTPELVVEGGVFQPLSDEPVRRYLGLNTQNKSINLHPFLADYFPNLVFDLQRPEGIPRDLFEALRDAAWWKALFGFGVVLRQSDRHIAIDPRFWWPILVRGVKVGSIIIYPYRVTPVGGGLSSQLGPPDRAHVIISLDSDPRAIVRDHLWSGVTLGRLLSEQVASPARVAVFGDGVSEFTKAGTWSLDAISARVAGINAILERFESPHIQAPVSAITFNSEGEPQLQISSKGAVLPVQPTDKDWKYLRLEGDSPLHQYLLQSIYIQIAANCSIPVDELIQSGTRSRAETGNAISAEHHPTIAKTALWQQEISDAAGDLGYSFIFPAQQRMTETPREALTDVTR